MLRNTHAFWTIAMIFMGLIAIRQMWRGYRRDLDWQTVDQNIGNYFMTTVDLGILLGALLWITQGRWDGADMAKTMNHPTLMIAAWAMVRFGWFQVQKMTISKSRFLRATLFFVTGILIMLFGVARIYQII